MTAHDRHHARRWLILAVIALAVHASAVVFWWSTGILLAGAIVTALLFEGREARAPEGAPAAVRPQTC